MAIELCMQMMGGGASVLLLMILLTVLVDDTLSVDSTKYVSVH